MQDTQYAIAYKEVLEILKHIPLEDYNKIPKETIELYKNNSSKNYIFIYNPEKTLDEQNVSIITKGIIAILYRDYWSTLEKKSKIINIQNQIREELENKKREKYNPDIFNNKEIHKQTSEVNLIKVEKFKWYEKILKFIKNFFYK